MARHTGGWVKFWRKAALGDINSNFTRGGMFGALIAMANIQESTVDWGGKPRKLVRGQIATSYHEIAELGGVDRKTVAKHLSYLRLRDTIKLEVSKQGIIITFPNYEQYCGVDATWSPQGPQGMDDGMDHPMDNGVPHNEERKNKRKKELKNMGPALPVPVVNASKVYIDCYREKYGHSPELVDKQHGILKHFAKSHPKRWEELIRGYLQMPDSWAVQRSHPVELLPSKVNEIVRYLETGKVVTKKVIEHAEEIIDKAQGTNRRPRKSIEELEAENAAMRAGSPLQIVGES